MDNTLAKIKAFNRDQVDHNVLVQRLVWRFCDTLMDNAISHDRSKWDDKEYEAFVDSRDSLNASKDGTDEDYQRNLKSEAIQHHITENYHHPEYWDKVGQEMPVEQAIIMVFDWYSRCLQKGTGIEDFWEYNMKKLENQPRAKAIAYGIKDFIYDINIEVDDEETKAKEEL